MDAAEKAERVFPSAIDPNTVFVWTRGGLLVSKDNGRTFAPRGKDLPAQLGAITAMLISPVRPATLYAGTLEKGVFLSEDEGSTWRALGGPSPQPSPLGGEGRVRGLAGLRIHALLFSADDPAFTTLYATHSPQVPGISMTIDGGRTWRSFATQFGAGDLVLAGTTMFFAGARLSAGGESGFYKSIDAGKNWFRILNVEAPTVLAASRTNPRRAWCGTQAGLFVTDNFGVSTYAVGPQTGMNIVSIAADFAAGGGEQVVVYDPNTEGVLRSTDGFKTWQKLNEGLYVGDWIAEGAMMAAAGSTLFACINGTLYRGAEPPGESALSSIRVEPAAVVAGEEGITITCRAVPGADVSMDLSPLALAATLPLLDDGQNGDGAAGDGIFGARLENVPLQILAKARDANYQGPRLPGTLALNVQAKAGGASQSSFALLTILQPAANLVLWNGENHSDLTVRGEGSVGLTACREHPYSGWAHLRLQSSGPGQAGLVWRQPGHGGSDDTRFHKFFTFCISSETEGASELRVMLRDDGAQFDLYNAQSSNQLKLAQFLPRLTRQYQRVAIPMADFILGATARPERIRELVFIVPQAETRVYDIDDVGLAVKPGPLLNECAAVLDADPASMLLTARVSSAGGKPQSVKAFVVQASSLPTDLAGKMPAPQPVKEFQLREDPRNGSDCYALRAPVAQAGTGTRAFRFVATDSDGVTEQKVAAFLPRRAPGQVARARGEVKLDGNREKYADAAPFVVGQAVSLPAPQQAGQPAPQVGGGKLELRARLLYDKHNLYVDLEVKDAAYDPQPPKKGQKKLTPEKLAEISSAELILTGPSSATYQERSGMSEADHHFVFVMDEKEGIGLRGRNRMPAKGTRTESGYVIEAQIPLDWLRTRKEACDLQLGKSTRIEWRLIGADGTKLAWAAPSFDASENPENWGLACFTGEAGAARVCYMSSEGKVLTLQSNKRLNAAQAQSLSTYEVPGMVLEKAVLQKDGRTILLSAASPWKVGQQITVKFRGLQTEDGFATQPELSFAPLPGRALNGELLHEFLVGEVKGNVDTQCVKTAQMDENVKPVRGPQWRLAETESGILDFGRVVGLRDNAIVYTHVYLFSNAERAVQVWTGSDDGARVVVNGAPVFSVPGSRGCVPDMDKIKNVKLTQGWNSLFVAVWNGGGGWEGCVRIMDEDGNPPQGVSYMADNPFVPAPDPTGTDSQFPNSRKLVSVPADAEKVPAACTADVTVATTDFMGWKGVWRVSNKVCEMVLVPQISRVMSFRLKDGQNVLWLNAGMVGKTVPADDKQWHNFGGDKVWPTEQGLWKKYTGRNGWPPPYWFDCAAGSAEAISGGVRLRSQKDPQFGAVCVREFVMDAQKPLVLIRQYYEKTEGPPVEMTLWTIAQTRKPGFALLPQGKESAGQRYKKLSDQIEALLTSHKTVLSFRNGDAGGQKAGVFPDAEYRDGWVAGAYVGQAVSLPDPKQAGQPAPLGTLFVISRRLERDAAYPDGGCHAELFLADKENGHYVELELLSPLRELKAGEKLVSNQVWQLVPSTEAQVADPEKAAALARAAHQTALEALGNEEVKSKK